MSRAITGNAPFLPAIVTSFALILLHRPPVMARFRRKALGRILKGRDRTLVRNGEIQWDEMRAAVIGEGDLLSALRRKG